MPLSFLAPTRLRMSADDLCLRYAELRETRGTVRAVNPVAISGEFCRYCGTGRKSWIVTKRTPLPSGLMREDRREICSDCRRGWSGEARDVIRAGGRSKVRGSGTFGPDRSDTSSVSIYPRRGAAESRLADETDWWRRLSMIFERRPHRVPVGENRVTMTDRRWRFCVEAWVLYLPDHISYREVLEHGPGVFPEFASLWTERKVKSGVAMARRVVEVRAARDPLLCR